MMQHCIQAERRERPEDCWLFLTLYPTVNQTEKHKSPAKHFQWIIKNNKQNMQSVRTTSTLMERDQEKNYSFFDNKNFKSPVWNITAYSLNVWKPAHRCPAWALRRESNSVDKTASSIYSARLNILMWGPQDILIPPPHIQMFFYCSLCVVGIVWHGYALQYVFPDAQWPLGICGQCTKHLASYGKQPPTVWTKACVLGYVLTWTALSHWYFQCLWILSWYQRVPCASAWDVKGCDKMLKMLMWA